MSSKKIMCFDIDGTICSITNGTYEFAEPKNDRINVVNRLYDEGYRILLFTARGSTTGIDWEEITKRQMELWGVNYHELHFGKPHYDVYVGDKALSDKVFFNTYKEDSP